MSAEPKGTFPPTLVHELRNQLSVIAGFCELLLDETPEADHRRRDLLEIQKATTAALHTLDQVPGA